MSKSRQFIVYEGWLTKSPPTKCVWRAKWRRRWFVLRQSGDHPSQYFLDYYSDRNSRKLKGTIDLDLCEQVDAGLQMQRRSSEGSGFRGSVFSIRTQSRIYHLEAENVTEMDKWVDVICKVCGMRSTEDTNATPSPTEPASNSSGTYIAISECFTGLPKQMNQDGDNSLIFVFNPQSMTVRADALRMPSANGSNVESPNHLKAISGDLTMASKKYSRPSQGHENDAVFLDEQNQASATVSLGTPMPPRPPKPSYLSLEGAHKESFAGPRIHEPSEVSPKFPGSKDNNRMPSFEALHNSQKSHRAANKSVYINTVMERSSFRHDIDQDHIEGFQGYLNLRNPPAVNRGLKPGRPRTSEMSLDNQMSWRLELQTQKLQYLDLDLDIPNKESSLHTRSRSEVDSPTVYKTVDFLKTEALNMTRMDTELRYGAEIPSHD